MRFSQPNKSSATDAPTAICRRCGEPFTPEPTGLKNMPLTRCCDPCKLRNLHDGLDLPTPPDLLDKHTKHPTLTKEEFYRRLNE